MCFEGLVSVLSFTMNNTENYQKPHSAKHCQPVLLNPITDPSGYIPVACGYPGRDGFPPSFFFFLLNERGPFKKIKTLNYHHSF